MSATALSINGVVGTPLTYIPITSSTPAWWAMYSGNIPPGISIVGAGSTSGGSPALSSRVEITGTPTVAGTYVVILTCASDTLFTITFTVSLPNPLDPPVITCAAATGAFPGGVGINSYGLVSGTLQPGTYNATAQASNYAWAANSWTYGPQQSAIYPFTLVVIPPLPVVSLNNQYYGYGGNYTVGDDMPNTNIFGVQDQAKPVTWSATGLPDGVTINPTSGFIAGKMTASGTYNVTIEATNSTGSGTFAQTLIVVPEQNVPVVSLTAQQPGYQGNAYGPGTLSMAVGSPVSIYFDATHNPTSWAAADLPTGLAIDAQTGTVSGLLRVPGSVRFFVTATNNVGPSAALAVMLTVTGSAQAFKFISDDPTLSDVQIDQRSGAVTFGRATPFKLGVRARFALIWLDYGSPVAPPEAAGVTIGIRVNGQYAADYVLPKLTPELVAATEGHPAYLLAEFSVDGDGLRTELTKAITDAAALPMQLMADVAWTSAGIPRKSQTFLFSVLPSVTY